MLPVQTVRIVRGPSLDAADDAKDADDAVEPTGLDDKFSSRHSRRPREAAAFIVTTRR
jgi:hypothetical protein